MSLTATSLPRSPGDDARAVTRVLEHSIALVLPICVLAFLATWPHTPWQSAIWTLPVWLIIVADLLSPADRRSVQRTLPEWPFDGLLYLLAGLQFLNIVLMVQRVSELQFSDQAAVLAAIVELLAIRILVGTNSCCSGFAVAHELIHRRHVLPRLLGRCLLLTVCYPHFAVEHLRCHHRHVGTIEDPATARLGETYRAYWRRTKKQQFLNAWRLENDRLHLAPPYRLSVTWLRHEVLLGILALSLLVAAIALYGGWVAVGIFLLQALAAVRLLETVNYFQHWGLETHSRPGGEFHAWVTDSWISLHVFVGLARHSDHHRHGAKPYQNLEFCPDGPRLPYGYFGMALLAKSFNHTYQRMARRELENHRKRARHRMAISADPAAPKPLADS